MGYRIRAFCKIRALSLPDFTLNAVSHGGRFGLLAVEVKPPSNGSARSDLRKIANELELMLEPLVDLDIENPTTCGVWVDGFQCHLYRMDPRYNGVYRLVESGVFELPRVLADILKVKPIMEVLLKLKI
ncbi:hypothetical protein BCR43DRAFT_514090 [Syncephalastrum racemosum]|uniref:Uncharacterized protein n=1 Tax=Syncephalastrum racemosum TaxID=13706 RepID=A0A1X2HFL1_SYNRA|nr:hypothetical protein BCR43DRAFT_514090 [Syncephalastrum racemosum]